MPIFQPKLNLDILGLHFSHKGLKRAIWPQFLQFCGPIVGGTFFGRNIGMWGVQSVAMERPALPALFQPIWNTPAGENGQNRTFGSLELITTGVIF